jgi:hypothetical protein
MDLYKLQNTKLDDDNNNDNNYNNDNIDNNQDSILEEDKKKHLTKLSVWNEFKEFYTELWDLLKIDLHNSYLFLTENKNYLVCAIILAFLLQFVDINNLGTSFEKFCNKNNINVGINLKGGGGEQPDVTTYRSMKAEEYAAKKDFKKQTKEEKKVMNLKQKGEKKGIEDLDAYASKKKSAQNIHKSKKSSIKAYDAEAKQKKKQESEAKANQKRISFFEGIKKHFGKGTEWGGKFGALGPVFGNMEKIIDNVKIVFYIVTVILTIAGILSIPVLIFLIITYMVFKTMVGKFVVL